MVHLSPTHIPLALSSNLVSDEIKKAIVTTRGGVLEDILGLEDTF